MQHRQVVDAVGERDRPGHIDPPFRGERRHAVRLVAAVIEGSDEASRVPSVADLRARAQRSRHAEVLRDDRRVVLRRRCRQVQPASRPAVDSDQLDRPRIEARKDLHHHDAAGYREDLLAIPPAHGGQREGPGPVDRIEWLRSGQPVSRLVGSHPGEVRQADQPPAAQFARQRKQARAGQERAVEIEEDGAVSVADSFDHRWSPDPRERRERRGAGRPRFPRGTARWPLLRAPPPRSRMWSSSDPVAQACLGTGLLSMCVDLNGTAAHADGAEPRMNPSGNLLVGRTNDRGPPFTRRSPWARTMGRCEEQLWRPGHRAPGWRWS